VFFFLSKFGMCEMFGHRFRKWRPWFLMTNAGYQAGASNKQRTDTVYPPADTGSGGNSLCSST
jgi:hypothetical protein